MTSPTCWSTSRTSAEPKFENHYPVRLVLGGFVAVSVDEASGVALRRHPESRRDVLAEADQGQERAALAVSPRRSTSCRRFSKSRGVPEPRMINGVRAEAHRGRQHGLHVGRREGRKAVARRSTSKCSATAPSITTDGWPAAVTASCRGRPPAAASIDSDTWELYLARLRWRRLRWRCSSKAQDPSLFKPTAVLYLVAGLKLCEQRNAWWW